MICVYKRDPNPSFLSHPNVKHTHADLPRVDSVVDLVPYNTLSSVPKYAAALCPGTAVSGRFTNEEHCVSYTLSHELIQRIPTFVAYMDVCWMKTTQEEYGWRAPWVESKHPPPPLRALPIRMDGPEIVCSSTTVLQPIAKSIIHAMCTRYRHIVCTYIRIYESAVHLCVGICVQNRAFSIAVVQYVQYDVRGECNYVQILFFIFHCSIGCV